MVAKASSSITTGAAPSSVDCSHWPAPVLNTSSAKIRPSTDRLAAATSAPRVSTVQYTRKRESCGRAEWTRQIRLNADSIPNSVTSTETTRAITPTAVSLPVLPENDSSQSRMPSAELGTKLAKMKLVSSSRHSSNTGNADSTPNTTIDS